MQPKKSSLAVTLALATFAVILLATSIRANAEKVLYSFQGGSDGSYPHRRADRRQGGQSLWHDRLRRRDLPQWRSRNRLWHSLRAVTQRKRWVDREGDLYI
jgi:hypothetical protein